MIFTNAKRAAIFSFVFIFYSLSQTAFADSGLLKRAVPDKTLAHLSMPESLQGAKVVVKFQEGSGVYMSSKSLLNKAGGVLPAGLTESSISGDLATIQYILSANINLKPMFPLPKASLASLKAAGESRSHKQLADLSLYYMSEWKAGNTKTELVELIKSLNNLNSVELAYVQPAPELADANTPDLTGSQGYLDDDNNGIAAAAAWALVGGRGENVRIIDIEGGWETDHEDLPLEFYYGGTENATWINHGTAVAGVMVGQDNGFGVTGIVSDAGIGYQSIFGTNNSIAQAIASAAAQLSAGDIILIEVHMGGPNTTTCTCNFTQCNYLPVEYWQANFDAIQTATANGIIVVEAAGNGSVDLDHATYANTFDRSFRDSGAIMVGASSSTSRTPTCFTNHGARIDLHGWGENVTTTGSGDAYSGTLGDRDEYTHTFSGTSSASPIVVGAVAAVQSLSIEHDGVVMTPAQVRDLLVDTGTPQVVSAADGLIGPLPDLAEAIAEAGWTNSNSTSIACDLGSVSASSGWYGINNASITNNGTSTINGWSVEVHGFAPAVPQVNWNWNLSSYTVNGSVLVISGNQSITPGASVGFSLGGPYSGLNTLTLSCVPQ